MRTFTNFSLPFGPNNPFPVRPQQDLPIRPIPYRPGHDIHSPAYLGQPLATLQRRAYTRILPPTVGNPRPPLSIVIPVPMRLGPPPQALARINAIGHQNHLVQARQEALDHGIRIPQPTLHQAPTPADSPADSPTRSPSRSRRNTIAHQVQVLPTIPERNESAASETRKPVTRKRVPDYEEPIVMPKERRWFDPRTWRKSKDL